jgi:hypothetical protein
MQELPERLWDMILNRCPDLEEVTICSFSSSSRLFDFQRITSARWPKLHTLTLGSFGYQNDFTLSPPSDFSLGDFLAAHPSLKYIRLSWNFKRWMSPETVPLYLPPTALPELATFIGIYQQLAELPNPSSLETLDLTCEPIYESRLPVICPILRNLTSLTSLDIWTHVPDPDSDHTQFFRSILDSCRKLTDLHFMCTTPFTLVSIPPSLPSYCPSPHISSCFPVPETPQGTIHPPLHASRAKNLLLNQGPQVPRREHAHKRPPHYPPQSIHPASQHPVGAREVPQPPQTGGLVRYHDRRRG